MITTLDIKGFKSIKHASLRCNRINVFLGEPNVGKSNLLEALGLLSSPCFQNLEPGQFKKLVRFENFANLFTDEEVSIPIEIVAQRNLEAHGFRIDYHPNNAYIGCYTISRLGSGGLSNQGNPSKALDFTASPLGISTWRVPPDVEVPFRAYKFEIREQFPVQEREYLLPLDGANLLYLLRTNSKLYRVADELFSAKGFRLVLRSHENKLEVQNTGGARLAQFPYSTVSDTLQRFLFHLVAVMTNKDAVISLEEPESHAFPYYTKQIAETIALDENGNQFFISTHNPYFLIPLIEKTPKAELSIFLTTLKGYETKFQLLDEERVRDLAELDADLFFNFARFAER